MGLLVLVLKSLFTESLLPTLLYFLVPVLILSGIDGYFDTGSVAFWKIALQNAILFVVGAVAVLVLYISTPANPRTSSNPYAYILLPAACGVFFLKWLLINSFGLVFAYPFAIIVVDTLILSSIPIIVSFKVR